MNLSTVGAIAGRFAEFTTSSVTCDLDLVPRSQWDEYSGRTHAFGWLEPHIHDDGNVTLSFCPELIAHHVAEYGEQTIEQYLMLIEFITARHIVHWELDDDERWKAVEDDVWEMHEGAPQFLEDVQFDIMIRSF